MHIRLARATETELIAAVVQRAYAVYVPRIGRRPAPMDDDYASKVGAGQVFVAEADRAIAGLIVLLKRPDHLMVENVAVDPGLQKANPIWWPRRRRGTGQLT